MSSCQEPASLPSAAEAHLYILQHGIAGVTRHKIAIEPPPLLVFSREGAEKGSGRSNLGDLLWEFFSSLKLKNNSSKPITAAQTVLSPT